MGRTISIPLKVNGYDSRGKKTHEWVVNTIAELQELVGNIARYMPHVKRWTVIWVD